MTDDSFRVERIGAVARCSMNHPQTMNALNLETGAPMAEAIHRLVADASVSVIILRAEGDNFCTGSDLALLGDNLDPGQLRGLMNRANAMLLDLYQGPKIVITEVDGFALGGGLGLALASDLTLATERARFCCGFIRIGAVPDLGVSYFLPERVGLLAAKEIALTGDILEAPRALAMGLINRVVPHEEIAAEVLGLARRIAKAPAEALAWTKRNLNRGVRVDLITALDIEAHVQPLMLMTQAHKEAIRKLLSRIAGA
jgi:2-(1,2-epoxy-1,2-dihydrophenyl)acetyl-CoA isomerase